MRSLKGTISHGLFYGGYSFVLEGYSNANWISDTDETKDTSGFIYTLAGNVVAWNSTRQTCISRSTMEAEFIALNLTREEADWFRNLLVNIPLWNKSVPVICIHYDSQVVIAKVKFKTYNRKPRHIHLRIKQLRKYEVIAINLVKSEKNLADPLTKSLSRRQVLEASSGMWVKPVN